MKPAPLVEVTTLEKRFPVGEWRPFQPQETVHALDRVSFTIEAGETGTIVEVFEHPSEAYLVEFSNDYGEAVAL